MRLFRRRKKHPLDIQGFIPLVAAAKLDKKSEGGFYRETIDPSIDKNEKIGFYEPPCFISNFQGRKVGKTKSLVDLIELKRNSEHNCEQKRDDSIETVAETITTESTAKMSETPSSQISETPSLLQEKTENVRPVLITVEPKGCSDDTNEAYSTDILNNQAYISPPRKACPSINLQGNSSEEQTKLSSHLLNSPISAMSVVSAMSTTTFDDSMVDRSGTTFSMTASKSLNESSVTGVSIESSWDNDSLTRESGFDNTTIGSESHCTVDNHTHFNNARWEMPSNVSDAMKKIAYAIQIIMEDLSQCGVYLVKTTEDTVCGSEEIDERFERKFRNRLSRDGRGKKDERMPGKRS
mmetsp:Transcript_20893/g.23865  ORF Transcript_20893/g.23865 Transcript_20893/m.23865 type:complete len:352 (-) Transcript_20893:223-1278(-)